MRKVSFATQRACGYASLCSFSSLYDAHIKARRGKLHKRETIEFELSLAQNLARLRDELLTQTYDVAGYEHYRHHGSQGYVLKFDVRSYYRSIDHAILKELFDKYFYYDPRVRWLTGTIIDSFADTHGKGIPLGNQASSWFAITYLDGLDRLIKERQRLKYYSRYMDDGVVVHESKDYLKRCLAQMRDYLREERALELNQKTQIVPLSQGVDYLGFHLYLTDTGRVIRKLRSSNKRRMKAKLKRFRHAYAEGKIELEQINKSVASYRAHLEQGDTWRLRQNLLRHLVLTRQARGESWGRTIPDAECYYE